MLKNLFITFLLAVAVSSCSTYKTMLKANDNVKKVELGMTKDQVVSIMGDKTYRMSGLKESSEGLLEERIWYPATQGSIFIFVFVDDKLIEWSEKFLKLESEETKE